MNTNNRPQEACFIRSSSEAAHFRQNQKNEALFLCLTYDAYETCQENGWPSYLLDEEAVESDFKKINTWGLDQTFRFVERFRADRKKYFFMQANFMYVEGLFTQLLKACLVLEQIDGQFEFSTVYYYKNKHSWIEAAAASYYKATGKSARFVQLSIPEAPVSFKEKLRLYGERVLARVANAQADSKIRKIAPGKNVYLLSGGLNHLRGLAEGIAQASNRVLFCESAFNLEKYRFCRKNGMIFKVLEPEAFNPFAAGETIFKNGEINYDGKDLTAIFNEVFHFVFDGGHLNFLFGYKQCESIFNIKNIKSVLLDEDMGPRRLFLMFAGETHRNCYVTSHGVPGIQLTDEGMKRLRNRYHSGITFVQSAFEKKVYGDILYDGSRFAVTGVPRYDALHRIKKETAPSGNTKLKILYCGSSLRSLPFDSLWPWLGIRDFYRQNTKLYTEDLFAALTAMPVDRRHLIQLKIKPHYNQEAEWLSITQKLNKKNLDCEILSHRENIFKWEAWADVVITPESSVICESLMMDKPVIILNYTKKGLVAPFNERGLFEEVRSRESFEEAIRKIFLIKPYTASVLKRWAPSRAYYEEPFDGQSTARALDYILNNKTVSAEHQNPKAYETVSVL